MTTLVAQPPARRPWPTSAYDTLLWVLFLGPIASPLLRASGLPLLSDAGVLARDLLATFVCPTPERSIMLLGLPMAVCVRCWGATIGLWAARLALPHIPAAWAGTVAATPWPLRLALAALPFLLWPLEIVGQAQGLWFAPLWLLLLNGALAGFAAGIFFLSVWPGMWPARPQL